MGGSRICPELVKEKGGIAGGNVADRDFLVQRRFQHENKTFPLKHLAQANGVKKI